MGFVLLLALLGTPPALAGPAQAPSEAALVEFALGALAREPQARIEDAYKWLYQATRGGEHAVADETGPRRWLDAEWKTLGPSAPGEPLVVPLRPDGLVVRLNLRPYRASGGGREELLAAFLRSARRFEADPAAFRAAWTELGERLRQGPRGRLDRDGWERLEAEASRAGYPALHHHPAYAAATRPAYRVLTAAEARALVELLPTPSPAPEPARGGPGR